MPINREAIVYVLQELSSQKGLKCTVNESARGAFTAGSFALGGGLLGGPIGLAIGGTIGSVLAALSNHGKFKPVAQVLSEELTPAQRTKLEQAFINIFKGIDANDVMSVVAFILKNGSLETIIINLLERFLKNEMSLYLKS